MIILSTIITIITAGMTQAQHTQIKGLVQSSCGKINVIVTLTFYPPPSLLLASQHFS